MRVLATLMLASTLSGCASIGSGINDARDWVNDPQTQAALVSIRTVSTALVCDVSAAASFTAKVAADLNKAKVSNNGKLVAVTAGTVCTALGGSLTGNTTTAGPAVAAVVQ